MLSDNYRRFLSQNLLNALRTFVEYIAVKIYLTGKKETVNYDNETVRIALDEKCRGNIKFIERFHYYLQISRSHYIENNDSDLTTIVPFSVTYVVSIHKSQGL